jgi:2,4-diketo-3-deoxy-L-fuconate hydrolase
MNRTAGKTPSQPTRITRPKPLNQPITPKRPGTPTPQRLTPNPSLQTTFMKLVRYGNPGQEKPGLIDAQGQLRDLSAVVQDIGPDQFGDAALAKLHKLKPEKPPLVKGQPRLGSPVSGVGRFIAIGLNYADHAAEADMPMPPEPIVFMKATTCTQGPHDPVMLPKGSKKSDWEVELGVVMGTRARYVSQKDALSHVAGYCNINDISERE